MIENSLRRLGRHGLPLRRRTSVLHPDGRDHPAGQHGDRFHFTSQVRSKPIAHSKLHSRLRFGSWILGAFYGNVGTSAGGTGFFVSNLNTLYNPLDSGILLKSLPVVFENYEGSAYLGAGMLLLCIAALCLFVRKGAKQRIKSPRRSAFMAGALVMVLLSVLVALGPNITLNSRILLTIPYPAPILQVFFRVSRQRPLYLDPILPFNALSDCIHA